MIWHHPKDANRLYIQPLSRKDTISPATSNIDHRASAFVFTSESETASVAFEAIFNWPATVAVYAATHWKSSTNLLRIYAEIKIRDGFETTQTRLLSFKNIAAGGS